MSGSSQANAEKGVGGRREQHAVQEQGELGLGNCPLLSCGSDTHAELSAGAYLAAFFQQHNRFVLDCKDKEPDVLFVGDSMVQLLQQYEVLFKKGGRVQESVFL